MCPRAGRPPRRVRRLARLGELLGIAPAGAPGCRAAPATARMLASDICPASSTNSVSTLAASPAQGPQPAGARGHVQLAVAQSRPQLLVTHHHGVRMPVRVVAIRPLADPRRSGSAPPRMLVHGADEMADDRVRRPGDADGAAPRDELEDLLGRGVRLPGPRRSLHRQVRTTERGREPGRGGTGRFTRGPQRSGRNATVIRRAP